MTQPENGGGGRNGGQLIGALAVLGGGVGALVGTLTGELGSGIWIGGAIGVGLGMLGNFFMSGR